MLRSEFPSLPGSIALEPLGRPTDSAGGSAFAALFREIRAEVADFIDQGSDSPSLGLSAEGRFHQARMQSAAAVGIASGEEGAQQDFLAAIAPWAQEAGQRLGVAAEVIAAHAALESGWGQRPLRQPDGSDSHNLFGIKAGGNWSGAVTSALTTEYENGQPQHRTERFRSYPDPASAFQDFARLLLDSPRYHGALNTGNDARAYAQGLMRGGYATDPAYADKLARLAARLHSGD